MGLSGCHIGKNGDHTLAAQGADGNHFIVIAGMDADGKLIINDPNSRARSEKTWDYYLIYDQIDTMWVLCGHDYVG